MHITDYGLWFYCVEEGVYFEKPEEFVDYMKTSYGLEELKAVAEAASTDGISGFITRSCDICYNGKNIDTSLKMKYLPKINGVTIETRRAKKILDSECYEMITKQFKIMHVQRQQNRLSVTLILDYRNPNVFQRESLPAPIAR